MQIHFLRHATFVIKLNGLNILVDPMLSPAEAMEPIANAGNQWRIPMVELPLMTEELDALLQGIDVVLVTHTHRDHWDAYAQEILPKHLPILCQPEDQALFERAGFSSVLPIQQQVQWQAIQIFRTGGHHGRGELGEKMGPVSGFVLKAQDEPTLYISGDTIWCPEVEQALTQFSPQVAVLYTGAATYATGGGPITMTDDEVCLLSRRIPTAQVVAVHMDTINHCRLTRAMLRQRLTEEHLIHQVLVPENGELLAF